MVNDMEVLCYNFEGNVVLFTALHAHSNRRSFTMSTLTQGLGAVSMSTHQVHDGSLADILSSLRPFSVSLHFCRLVLKELPSVIGL